VRSGGHQVCTGTSLGARRPQGRGKKDGEGDAASIFFVSEKKKKKNGERFASPLSPTGGAFPSLSHTLVSPARRGDRARVNRQAHSLCAPQALLHTLRLPAPAPAPTGPPPRRTRPGRGQPGGVRRPSPARARLPAPRFQPRRPAQALRARGGAARPAPAHPARTTRPPPPPLPRPRRPPMRRPPPPPTWKPPRPRWRPAARTRP